MSTDAAIVATVVVAPYLVLSAAYVTPRLFRLPRRAGDYSYGVYVYAFPVQQTLSFLLLLTSGWLLFVLATPITLALAVLSWHFVERPALGLKWRIAGAEPPAGAAEPTVSSPEPAAVLTTP